jgi:phage terminase large subunit-like protein
METVSVLSSNEVVSCLWNKNAREKCRIGLADIILYEQSAPSKWYFTGKTGMKIYILV